MALSQNPLAQEVLSKIQQYAIAQWGDRWLLELVQRYVSVSKSAGDDAATTVNRRPQIERIFKENSCNLGSFLLLAKAAGINVELTVQRIEKL
jgi:hypothetical protein